MPINTNEIRHLIESAHGYHTLGAPTHYVTLSPRPWYSGLADWLFAAGLTALILACLKEIL